MGWLAVSVEHGAFVLKHPSAPCTPGSLYRVVCSLCPTTVNAVVGYAVRLSEMLVSKPHAGKLVMAPEDLLEV